MAEDDHLAFVYYQKAALKGDGEAQNSLGHCYEDGSGCEQNYERATEWYAKAALQGNARGPRALGDLGSLCYDGTGVPQNRERAVELYRQSVAIEEDFSALYNLAVSRTISHRTKFPNTTNEHALQ